MDDEPGLELLAPLVQIDQTTGLRTIYSYYLPAVS